MSDNISEAITRMFKIYDDIPGVAIGWRAVMDNRFAYSEIGEEAMAILDQMRSSVTTGVATAAGPKMTEIGGTGPLSVNEAYMLSGCTYITIADRRRLADFISLVPKLAQAVVELSREVKDRDGLSNHAEIMVDRAGEILAQSVMRFT